MEVDDNISLDFFEKDSFPSDRSLRPSCLPKKQMEKEQKKSRRKSKRRDLDLYSDNSGFRMEYASTVALEMSRDDEEDFPEFGRRQCSLKGKKKSKKRGKNSSNLATKPYYSSSGLDTAHDVHNSSGFPDISGKTRYSNCSGYGPLPPINICKKKFSPSVSAMLDSALHRAIEGRGYQRTPSPIPAVLFRRNQEKKKLYRF